MTRQLLSLSIVLAVFVLSVSCKKELAGDQSAKQLSDVPLYEKLKAAGFREDQIQDLGDAYLVSGDLLFKKQVTDLKKVDQYFALKRAVKDSSAHTEQWQHPNSISSFNVENIKVYVTPALETSYEIAFQEAMEHWAQDPNSKIDFNFIDLSENSGLADVTFMQDNSISGAYAVAEFPSGGEPGWRIRLNTNVSAGLSFDQKIFLFAHEMGHVLGLYHTDEYHPGYLIPGTPQSDPNSVMNSGGYHGGIVPPWNGFSAYDKIAVEYLYPWGTYDKWITFPAGKFTALYGYSIYGGNRYDDQYCSFDVNWNSSLVNTPTVTLQLYEKGTLKGTLAANVPNTGSYHVSNTPLLPTNTSPAYLPLIQIRIISDANPAISDYTSTFWIGLGD